MIVIQMPWRVVFGRFSQVGWCWQSKNVEAPARVNRIVLAFVTADRK
jgi:hypothetical protein